MSNDKKILNFPFGGEIPKLPPAPLSEAELEYKILALSRAFEGVFALALEQNEIIPCEGRAREFRDRIETLLKSLTQ